LRPLEAFGVKKIFTPDGRFEGLKTRFKSLRAYLHVLRGSSFSRRMYQKVEIWKIFFVSSSKRTPKVPTNNVVEVYDELVRRVAYL
jgi:hypothetical protein